MRYQNWDVLLFPEATKVPTQEFKTSCYVIREAESHALVPAVTTFVGSMKQGAAFRVSVHSWQRPTPSSMIQSYVAPDDTIMFEARVYIDGVSVASHIFDHRTVWPVVIERDSRLETDGHVEPLRFPRFHQAILEQQHWDANDNLGRIRVTISEGLARSYHPDLPQRAGFENFRDVVTFSFQHAPMHVLEYSNIAWPTAQMFRQAQNALIRPPSIGNRQPLTMDYEAHAHSPRRVTPMIVPELMTCFNDPGQCLSRACTHPAHVATRQTENQNLYQSRWAPPYVTGNGLPSGIGGGDDPFMGPPKVSTGAKRSGQPQASSSLDVSMEDYIPSTASHSRAYTEMSGVAYPPKDFEKTMNEAAIQEIVKALSPVKKDQLLRALSPEKEPNNGTEPPNNTPSSLPFLSANVSPADKILATSYAQVAGRNISLDANASVPTSRAVSAVSSRPEQATSAFRHPQRSESSASSNRSANETKSLSFDDHDTIEVQPVVISDDPDIPLKSASRVPLVESRVTSRIRSVSNASKRKRSLSLKKGDCSGKVSPARATARQFTPDIAANSPAGSNDASPQTGGVALGA